MESGEACKNLCSQGHEKTNQHSPVDSPAQPGLHLQLKPFGKDGVRLLWGRGNVSGRVDVEYLHNDAWLSFAPLTAEYQGIIVVRSIPDKPGLQPARLGWRLNGDKVCTDLACIDCSKPKSQPLQPAVALHDAERVFNVMQWYSTVIIDCRMGHHLTAERESGVSLQGLTCCSSLQRQCPMY